MPTYEYKCEACGHAFEKFQSITADAIRKCPECGKLKVKRLIGTGAGMIFKGSGFYITDYRSEGYKKSAGAESGTPAPATDKGPAADKGTAAAPAAGESKPAPKPEAAPAPKAEPKTASKSAKKR